MKRSITEMVVNEIRENYPITDTGGDLYVIVSVYNNAWLFFDSNVTNITFYNKAGIKIDRTTILLADPEYLPKLMVTLSKLNYKL